ncbi:EAL domain-containing protein [Saccharopolyspora rhizosphaerae]|uniref:EAL domain-containing protein n=1 Tax=Saccharopolyspora rhizosphaerae TaxID=2492662 RepID=A0A3R8QEV0_9PSEU|nr:EAL domain-containing protein [Saccharopolyspora rhizosphaerae]RRO19333.1 EAL domain-containing protein [Saccharopolyspora rhizosphaerae]
MAPPAQAPWELSDLGLLQRIVLTGSIEDVAKAIVDEAAGGAGGDLSCGLTLPRRPDGQLLVASSDGLAQRLDRLQQSQRDGPCVWALSTGHTVEVETVNDRLRWPLFAEQSREAGVPVTLSVPLNAATGTVGALNLDRKEPWSEAERERAYRFAEHVASTVALAQRLAPLNDALAEDESAELVSQLREQVAHDELTGLLNRRGLGDVLTELLDNGLRENVAVLFCDLDNFKRINDGLGHDAGDELLHTLARRLRGGLPAGCVPARLSGDEFVVLCPDVNAVGGLEALTDQVGELLRITMPLRPQGMVEVSASIGACTVSGPETTVKDLFRYADAAMYATKERGPGSVSVADASLIAEVDAHLGLESDLRRALEDEDLVLHYQPIVDRGGVILMAEALLRWPHPEHGMLSPATILATAHRGNLVNRLDEYVLRRAASEAAAWSELAPNPPAVAVNLSVVPDDPRYSEHVVNVINRTGLEWSRLVLEITEIRLATLAEPARRAMLGLTSRGMRFALDDFGTGYSSLVHFERPPVSIIKLSGNFISDLAENPTHRGITTAVLAMVTSMGQVCIAEGVENPAQFQILANLGFSAFQGYLFCRPVSLQELHTLLAGGPLPMP